MQRVDVAIIGGGLVGASLACALAGLTERHRLRIAVIEATPLSAEGVRYQPSFDERSSALSYGSRLHFERLGLWHDAASMPGLAREAAAIERIHIAERGRFGAVRLDHAEMKVEALGYVVPNAWMGEVLMRRLERLSIDWRCPAQVVMVESCPGGHRLTLDDGAVLEAGLTVLADGGRSPLKARLGIASRVHDYGQHALIGNLELGRDHMGIAYERFDPRGPMALLPLRGRRMALVWTLAPQALERMLELDDRAFLAEVQAFFGDRLGRFQRIGARRHYPLRLVQACEQVRPHLAVLGNAAHSLHPVAGQGFNLALRGVLDLRDALEVALESGRTVGETATMMDFESRRRRDRDVMVQASHRLVELFGIGNPMLSHLRAAGLVGLNLASPLRRALTRRAMGLER
ncbi:2-octaprenyl-6-methoxyphenyl hydroxylase [Halotalea alkalilenta]|uniref:2-octaprenyl-6-methoxyphenyl hydroxylase n=1 Tax=Halotalea alkalilenta TaxID=376489 RepID=UPI00047F9AE8|nr:2-octaprenyl-6-methoxyphenyl hydroxylase [Halotalea alkalilenta]